MGDFSWNFTINFLRWCKENQPVVSVFEKKIGWSTASTLRVCDNCFSIEKSLRKHMWHLSWNHLVAKNSQKRFAYVIVNNSLWQLLFIWKVAEKTHWNITLSYLSLTIFMLAALILMNVHLRHCYILKSKICDTNHEITRLLKTHKTLMKL